MKIAIIKYNAGNIMSVDYALQRLGIHAIVTEDAELIRSADKVIFPGVGEASTTMQYLKEHKLDTADPRSETACAWNMPWTAADVPAFRRREYRMHGHF